MPDSPSHQDLPGEPVDAPDPELPTDAAAHLAATGWGREGQGSWPQSGFPLPLPRPSPPALTPPSSCQTEPALLLTNCITLGTLFNPSLGFCV